MSNSDRPVDFGFEKVAWAEKAQRVRSVFTSVAGKYDVMNDLMSFGVHRLWKQFTLSLSGLRPGQRALDVAGGTGDLALGMLRQVGKQGSVVLSDINPDMLERGRDRLLDMGAAGNVECLVADAERLPFDDNSFDCVKLSSTYLCRRRSYVPSALKNTTRNRARTGFRSSPRPISPSRRGRLWLCWGRPALENPRCSAC